MINQVQHNYKFESNQYKKDPKSINKLDNNNILIITIICSLVIISILVFKSLAFLIYVASFTNASVMLFKNIKSLKELINFITIILSKEFKNAYNVLSVNIEKKINQNLTKTTIKIKEMVKKTNQNLTKTTIKIKEMVKKTNQNFKKNKRPISRSFQSNLKLDLDANYNQYVRDNTKIEEL